MKYFAIILFLFSCTHKKTVAVLNGSKSYDPNGGKILVYKWSQLSGLNAKIITPASAITKVELPKEGIYTFELWGKNDAGLSNKDTTIIKVIE